MTTIAEDIALHLENRGFGTRGTDIWHHVLRDEPDDAVLISEGGGQGAARSLDGARIINEGVSVIVRAAQDGFQAGYTRAHGIYDAMLDLTNTAIDGRRYIGANPLGDVGFLGRDEKERWKWSMSFIVKTV